MSDAARTAALRRAVEGLRSEGRAVVDLAPGTAHEAITRRMVEELASDMAEVRNRVNSLLFLVAGAVLLEVILRIGGWR